MNVLNTCAAIAVLSSGLAHAQIDSMPTGSNAASPAPAATMKLTDGEIRKVDLAAGTVTLHHGKIENLGMPGMTMVFKVMDPKSLGSLKQGDKVGFRAERVNGEVVVTHLEAAK